MSEHGGRRQGSGRKSGSRDKGKAALAAVQALNGETPIAFFAGILANAELPLSLRFAAAKELAPYMHPRLSSVEANVKATVSHDEFWSEIKRDAALNGHINGKATPGAS